MKQESHFRDGPAVAAIFSAGLGIFVLGLCTVLASANPAVNHFLNWHPPAGPLSGKSSMAVLVWLAAWGALHLCWRRKEIKFAKIWRFSLALIFLGFLLTFPPVFEWFHQF